MGFLDWLLGSNDDPDDRRDSPDGEMVEFVDEEGREVQISREEYRERILPRQFDRAGDDPDALYETIRMALDDGFAEICLEPARRLREIDSNPERGATILGLTYWRLDRLDDAEEVYRSCIDEHGESGVLLTNMAKLHDERGDAERARETLWRALELNPNLPNAVDWWASLAVDDADDIDEQYRTAIEEIAELPDSWYARVRLAQFYFEQDRDERALECAEEVADIAPEEPGALMGITGRLGARGYADQMLQWFSDVYDPSTHRPRTGLNLVQACLETGRTELGRQICEIIPVSDDPHVEDAVDEARDALDSR